MTSRNDHAPRSRQSLISVDDVRLFVAVDRNVGDSAGAREACEDGVKGDHVLDVPTAIGERRVPHRRAGRTGEVYIRVVRIARRGERERRVAAGATARVDRFDRPCPTLAGRVLQGLGVVVEVGERWFARTASDTLNS